MTKRDGRAVGVVAWLASALPSLTPSEQRVASVILEDPAQAAHLTISNLANLADTSETTVTRLCRSLNIDSYSDLRIALATESGRAAVESIPLSADIEPDDELSTIVAKVGSASARAASETVKNLDIPQFELIVEAITGARQVDLYGVGASGHVVRDLQEKLHRIGVSCFVWTDAHMALPSAANLSAADLAVGISYSGTTTDTIDALKEAKKAGATTAAITNFSRSPIVSVADIVLLTSGSEIPLRSGAMVSRIAALTVVDCIFLGVAHRHYPATVTALERTRQSVSSRHRPTR